MSEKYWTRSKKKQSHVFPVRGERQYGAWMIEALHKDRCDYYPSNLLCYMNWSIDSVREATKWIRSVEKRGGRVEGVYTFDEGSTFSDHGITISCFHNYVPEMFENTDIDDCIPTNDTYNNRITLWLREKGTKDWWTWEPQP